MPKTSSSTSVKKPAAKKAARKTVVKKTIRKTTVGKTGVKTIVAGKIVRKPVAATPEPPKRSRARVLNEHPGNLAADPHDHAANEAIATRSARRTPPCKPRKLTATDIAAVPPSADTPAGSMVARVSDAIERELSKIERIVGNPSRLYPAQRIETESRARVLASLARTLKEVGCPAVDKGANQPSAFPDARSIEGTIPYFSNGQRDDLIQRRYIEAVIAAFDPAFGADVLNPVSPVYGGRMVDVSGLHLWTWDARPYPVFPAAEDVWSDGPNWQTGHWLTGRLGAAPLDALVGTILDDANVAGARTDNLRESCDGYVIDRPMSPRAAIDPLAMAYAFDATVAGGELTFVQRGAPPVAEIDEDELVDPQKGALARLTRGQETELPREVSFGFTDGAADYRRSAVTSRRLVGGSNRTLHSDFAVITDDAAATRRADIWLQDLWAGRESIELSLGMKRLSLAPGDVIGVTVNARRRLFEISELVDTQSRQVKARSIDPEVFSVPLFAPRVKPPMIPPALGPVQALVLDLPSIDSSEPPVLTRLAILADPWPGSVAVWRSTDGLSFEKAATALVPSIIGETLDPLPAGPTSCWHRSGEMRVALYGRALASIADARVLDGANAAAVLNASGVWEILQFANAELVGDKTYKLSRLLRGQAGSEYAIADPLPAGSPFVLLDDHVVTIARGLSALDRAIDLRIVATGRSHDDPSALALTMTPQPFALMPLSPVHVKAVRAGDGIHVSWIRRTRRDGDNWGVEVPLGEDTEAYTLDILSGTSVVRSMSSAAPSVLYANADELADFGTPQPSLHGRVSQMSSTVGRGHPAEFTLTL